MEVVIHENALNKEVNKVTVDQTDFIKCSACNRNLMRVAEGKKIEGILYNVCVSCPCGDKSFSREVRGDFPAIPGEGLRMMNLVQDDKTNTMTFIMEEVK